jgi:hypothetical protein
MEAIILHPQNKEQLSVFKKLFKTMAVPFETKKEEEIIVGFASNGQPFTVFEYKKNLQNRIDDVRSGTSKTSSSEQVLNRILKR